MAWVGDDIDYQENRDKYAYLYAMPPGHGGGGNFSPPAAAAMALCVGVVGCVVLAADRFLCDKCLVGCLPMRVEHNRIVDRDTSASDFSPP